MVKEKLVQERFGLTATEVTYLETKKAILSTIKGDINEIRKFLRIYLTEMEMVFKGNNLVIGKVLLLSRLVSKVTSSNQKQFFACINDTIDAIIKINNGIEIFKSKVINDKVADLVLLPIQLFNSDTPFNGIYTLEKEFKTGEYSSRSIVVNFMDGEINDNVLSEREANNICARIYFNKKIHIECLVLNKGLYEFNAYQKGADVIIESVSNEKYFVSEQKQNKVIKYLVQKYIHPMLLLLNDKMIKRQNQLFNQRTSIADTNSTERHFRPTKRTEIPKFKVIKTKSLIHNSSSKVGNKNIPKGHVKCPHYVRGYWRHYKSGKVIWVKGHYVHAEKFNNSFNSAKILV